MVRSPQPPSKGSFKKLRKMVSEWEAGEVGAQGSVRAAGRKPSEQAGGI